MFSILVCKIYEKKVNKNEKYVLVFAREENSITASHISKTMKSKSIKTRRHRLNT